MVSLYLQDLKHEISTLSLESILPDMLIIFAIVLQHDSRMS